MILLGYSVKLDFKHTIELIEENENFNKPDKPFVNIEWFGFKTYRISWFKLIQM